MRLIRLTPSTPQQIRDLVLDDPASVLSGARTLARNVPVPGRGVLDLIAAEPGGRLTLISYFAEAGAGELAQALARWDWAAENLPALRAMGALQADADLTIDPRLILVAPVVTDAARRLAGRLSRPPIEILLASLARAGENTALLIEPVAALGMPAAVESSVDPELGTIPAGSERSLLRRVVEQLREGAVFSPITGGVDVLRAGQRLGLLVCAAQGLEARLADGRVEPIATDDDCRRVAALMAAPAAPSPIAARPVGASLSPEELRELERGLGSRSAPPPSSGPASGSVPTSAAEN